MYCSSTFAWTALKSAPIVEINEWVKTLSANLNIKEDFPTPASPTIKICKMSIYISLFICIENDSICISRYHNMHFNYWSVAKNKYTLFFNGHVIFKFSILSWFDRTFSDLCFCHNSTWYRTQIRYFSFQLKVSILCWNLF